MNEREKGLLAFHEETQGASEYFIVSYSDLLTKMAPAVLFHNSEFAGQVLESVANWIGQMGRAKKNETLLCLNCDHKFTPSSLPSGFFIVLPFGKRTMMLITGICDQCFALEDLEEKAFQHLKKMWPEGYRVTQKGSS